MKIQADNLKRRREQIRDIPNPEDFIEKYELKFRIGDCKSTQIIKAQDLDKRFGNITILDNVSFIIENGDRIALNGKNGCGKSTLLKMFIQKELPTKGILKLSENLNIGYLNQEFEDMIPEQVVMDYLWEADQKMMEHHIIAALIKFGFDLKKMKNKLKTLSGGEKTRISIIKLMLSKCDLLLLDEPTNHLDLELIESLEKALKQFKGTVVFVSHDRIFVKKVANKIFEIEDGDLEIKEI